MATAKDGLVVHLLEDLEDGPESHTHGLDVLSEDKALEMEWSKNNTQSQLIGSKGTTYSTLDMDLCINSVLSHSKMEFIINLDGGLKN